MSLIICIKIDNVYLEGKLEKFILKYRGLIISVVCLPDFLYKNILSDDSAQQWSSREFHFSSVQLLSRVQIFTTPWIAACQDSLSITNSRSLPKLMPIESVMPSSNLFLCRPLLLLPPFLPASGSFPMSWLFAWGGQSIGASASASILPVNTQDWSPLGWTGWISLQSKGLSRVFSNTTVQKHQFFGAQLSL